MEDIQKILMKKEAQRRKKNMRLYPVYMMFGYDLAFYYAIHILFLSQVKQVSDANIMLLSSVYAISSLIVILPISAVTSKIGTRKALMYGNLLNAISTVCLIIGTDYDIFIWGQILSSLGFAFINISTSPMLKESIPHSTMKDKIFVKHYSNAYSKYCIFAAITTFLSGYLYNIDPYIPMYLCMFCSMIAFIVASQLVQFKKEEQDRTLKESMIRLKDVVQFGIHSKRLKALLLALGLIWGTLITFTTYGTTLLKNMEVSAEWIGGVLAVLELVKAVFSKKANHFHERYKNTSMTKILYTISISYVLIGMIANIQIPFKYQMAMILLLFAIIRGMHGIYTIVYNKYLNNFMKTEVLPSVYSMQSITDNIFRGIITWVASGILNIMNIQYAMLAIGALFVILTSIVHGYMRDRIGLNPLEYDKTDTKYARK